MVAGLCFYHEASFMFLQVTRKIDTKSGWDESSTKPSSATLTIGGEVFRSEHKFAAHARHAVMIKALNETGYRFTNIPGALRSYVVEDGDKTDTGARNETQSGVRDKLDGSVKDKSHSGVRDTPDNRQKDKIHGDSGVQDKSDSGLKDTSTSNWKDKVDSSVGDTPDIGVKDKSDCEVTDPAASSVKDRCSGDSNDSFLSDTSHSDSDDDHLCDLTDEQMVDLTDLGPNRVNDSKDKINKITLRLKDKAASDLKTTEEHERKKVKIRRRPCPMTNCNTLSVRPRIHCIHYHLPWYLYPHLACKICKKTEGSITLIEKRHTKVHEDSGKEGNVTIDEWVYLFCGFLHQLAEAFELNTLDELLTHVVEQNLLPNYLPDPSEYWNQEEVDLIRAFCDKFELTFSTDLHLPKCVGVLLHWKIIVNLLGKLPPEKQKKLIHKEVKRDFNGS